MAAETHTLVPLLLILDLTNPGGMGGKQVIARLKPIEPEVKAILDRVIHEGKNRL